MNPDRHRSKRTARGTALAIPAVVLSEPKLSRAEKKEIERAWVVEVRRRIADFEAGKIKCVPAEEALRNAYRAIGVLSGGKD